MSLNRSVIVATAALVVALAAAACSSSPAAEPVAPVATEPVAAEPTAVPTVAPTPSQAIVETEPVSKAAGYLTSQDVRAIIGDSIALTVEQLEPQAIDDSEAPVPVDAIDEWVITLFQAAETGAAIVFSVMDLATVKDAETVFTEVSMLTTFWSRMIRGFEPSRWNTGQTVISI